MTRVVGCPFRGGATLNESILIGEPDQRRRADFGRARTLAGPGGVVYRPLHA